MRLGFAIRKSQILRAVISLLRHGFRRFHPDMLGKAICVSLILHLHGVQILPGQTSQIRDYVLTFSGPDPGRAIWGIRSRWCYARPGHGGNPNRLEFVKIFDEGKSHKQKKRSMDLGRIFSGLVLPCRVTKTTPFLTDYLQMRPVFIECRTRLAFYQTETALSQFS